MDESEKRRERLRAMRMEAAQAENSNSVVTPAMPCNLFNPLVENSATMPRQEESGPVSRFDFYTDPMAAFSAERNRNNAGNQISSGYFTSPVDSCPSTMRFPSPLAGLRNPEMAPSMAQQFQDNYSPDHGMYQARGFGLNSSFQRSPMGISRPTMHQGNPDAWRGSGGVAGYNFPPNSSTDYNFPSPGFGPTSIPCFNTGQDSANWLNHSSSPVSGHGGSPSPNSGRGGDLWWRSSMRPASGHRGGRGNFNPGSGWRGGRGLGSHVRPRAPDRSLGPERYYNDSMVEDPWKSLKPVIWKGVEDSLTISSTPDSSRPWTPKYLGTKRSKTLEVSNRSSNQPSLAEYLAASFNEAVDDASSI
ncbi:hypothetical protein FNV43_RR12434 [Rhamnella rubrinervis]|uniref:Uncharacterized protein n=1 Tax=Rhamnella rubrinervis TaxID=2594499 RepID=A0A8K0H882_9ROSA|nr:hypothetical protein FNV43_RR12434 [Rhamnella rubrinervis]